MTNDSVISTRHLQLCMTGVGLILAILLSFGTAPAVSSATGKKLAGYELDQMTSANGKYKVFACSNAVRLDHLSYGYTLISHAPDWDVFVCRPDTKEYAQVPYKQWLKTNLIMLTTIWTMELKKPISMRHFDQGGLPYVRYTFPGTSVLPGFYKSSGRDEFKDLENNKAEIVCLDFPADVHAGGVVGRACALPELRGIAVKVVRTSAKTSSWTLKTLKTAHTDNLAADIFVLPNGFKKVPFTRALLSSISEKETVNDMLGGPVK